MLATTAAALLALSTLAAPVEPRRPGQESFLTTAVFAEGRLWVRSDAGDVSSVAPGEHRRRDEPLPGVALDLCVTDGRLLALAARGASWTLLRREGSAWSPAASLRARDTFVAMGCAPAAIALLTAREVVVLRNGKPTAIALSRPLPGGLTASLHVEGDELLAGVNRGEFGGGLVRVDLKTGRVTLVDRRGEGRCDGPLNAAGDPVHAVAPLPWKPGCVVAAVGLEHLVMSRGRLVELCGDDVRTLLSRPLGRRGPWRLGLPDETGDVAFYRVARAGDVLLAAGSDGLYRVSRDGVERQPMPRFGDVGGIEVSFDVPGFVLVLTDVNQRRSVSGPAPMLVPRGERLVYPPPP